MEIERNPIVVQAEVDDSDEVQELYDEIVDQLRYMVYWELLFVRDFLDKHMSNDWNSTK